MKIATSFRNYNNSWGDQPNGTELVWELTTNNANGTQIVNSR